MGRMKFENEYGKPEITLAMLGRIFAYLRPYILSLMASLAIMLICSSMGLVPPMIVQGIVDKALHNKDMPMLTKLVFASIGVTITLNLLQTLQSFINLKISKGIGFKLKNDMYSHLQHMSTSFFTTEKPGEIYTRITSDIDGVQDVFNSTVVSLFTSVFTFGTTLFALFNMNWKMALLALCTVPLYVIPTRTVAKKRFEITKIRQGKFAELNQLIQETLSINGAMLTKLFTKEKVEFNNFNQVNQEITELQMKESLTGRWFRLVMSFFTALGPLMVYLFGGMLYIRGEISVGVILTFAALLSRLYNPVMQLSNLHIETTRGFALFERIFEYFDKEPEIDPQKDSEKASIKITKGEIEFDNVEFSYDNNKKVLDRLNVLMPAGKITALVGSSGGGKTTITSLIPRLFQQQAGRILIDGQDTTKVNLESLRAEIGVVTQEPYLFHGTIRENLLYGNESATEQQLEAAAKAAFIDQFVDKLPDGYDTIVGNRGVKLSGGEKQRISIARVILKNPRILILDEATSALDSVSENIIQLAMDKLMVNRTSIVIAHRLSTIKNADKILVVNGGNIVEAGTHDELIEKGKYYNELYKKQFSKLENAA